MIPCKHHDLKCSPLRVRGSGFCLPVRSIQGHLARRVKVCVKCGTASMNGMGRDPEAVMPPAACGPARDVLKWISDHQWVGRYTRVATYREMRLFRGAVRNRGLMPMIAGGASRFFVGSGTNWSSTSSWSTTTGGASGAAVPTASDDVKFDANSPGNCTIDVTANCLTLVCTGFTHTLTHTTGNNLQIAGSTFTLVSGMTWTQGGASFVWFQQTTAGTVSVTTGGQPMGHTQYGNGASSATWSLLDNWTSIGGTQVISFVGGTLQTNNNTMTWGNFFSQSSNTRTSTFGTSAVTVTGGGICFDVSSFSSNLTWSASSATFTFTQGSTIRLFGSTTTGTINLSGPAAVSYSLAGAVNYTVSNLTLNGGSSGRNATLTIWVNMTLTNLTLNSSSAVSRILVNTGTVGTPQTVTVNSLVCTGGIDFMDIAAAGTATWSTASGATNFGDCGGNSGITFTTAATQTWSGNSTGNWSDATKWTSRVPLPQDNVVISGLTSGTVTADMPRLGANVDFTGSTGGTISNNISISSFGNLTLVSGITYNWTPYTLAGRGTQTITTNGASTSTNLTIQAPGGTYTIQDSLTVPSTFSVTLNNGTLNTNGKACSWGSFSSSNTNTRSLTLGTSTVTMTAQSGTVVWGLSTTTGMTLSALSSTIVLSGNVSFGSSNVFQGGGLSYGTLSITGGGAYIINAPSNTFVNLTRTGTAQTWDSLVLFANQTITGTLTLQGNSASNLLMVWDSINVSSLSSQVTFTLNGSFVLNNVVLQNVVAAGTATRPWTGTRVGDGGNNSGITFDAPRNLFWVATGGGNWSASSSWSTSTGGASGSNSPLPQDTVTFDGNSISSTGKVITVDTPFWGGNISFSAVTNSPSVSPNNPTSGANQYIYGSLTLVSGMTLVNSSQWYFFGRGGSYTLTTAGKAFTGSGGQVMVAAVSGTYTLQDNATFGGQLNIAAGTFDANGNNLTCVLFNSIGGNGNNTTRIIKMGSGTWTVTGNDSTQSGVGTWTVVDAGTSVTFQAGTSTLILSDTSSTAKTFTGGSKTYNNVSITGGGTGPIKILGTNTYNVLSVGAPKIVTFVHGITQTITQLMAIGTSGNLITMNSDSVGTAWTISCANPVACDYLSLQDSTASGSTPFYAGLHSTNVSNNTNWNFTAPVFSALAGSSTSSDSVALTAPTQIPLAAVSSVSSTAGLPITAPTLIPLAGVSSTSSSNGFVSAPSLITASASSTSTVAGFIVIYGPATTKTYIPNPSIRLFLDATTSYADGGQVGLFWDSAPALAAGGGSFSTSDPGIQDACDRHPGLTRIA